MFWEYHHLRKHPTSGHQPLTIGLPHVKVVHHSTPRGWHAKFLRCRPGNLPTWNGPQGEIHPGNWTWNLKIGTLEKEIPNLETISFRFYVKLWGCKIYQLPEFRVKDLWFCRGSNIQRWSYMQIMTIPRLPVIPPEMNGVWGMFGWGPFIPPKTKVSK